MFTIGESQAISHANGTEQQTQERRIQQPAVNPRRGRFATETPLQRERRLEIQREQRRRRRQQQTAEQRQHHLARRRQRRQQQAKEQRNRRLEYQRQYRQGRSTLHLNNLNNLSNTGPLTLSHETPEQREHRLQRLRTAQSQRLHNETEQERKKRLQTLRQNAVLEFRTKPNSRGNNDYSGSEKMTQL